jgi:predicted GTPase
MKNINCKVKKIIHDEERLIEHLKAALKKTRSFEVIDFTVEFICNFLEKID